jgi:hypothetical protein
MTIIALPSGHDHLADALVRDLGFTKMHVDQAVRAAALDIDPIVDSGFTLANMGSSPRLTSRLLYHGSDWERLQARIPEVVRVLDKLRNYVPADLSYPEGDSVITGVNTGMAADRAVGVGAHLVAIAGRAPWDIPDAGPRQINLVIPEGGVVDQQTAIVRYVQGLRQPAKRGTKQTVSLKAGDVVTTDAGDVLVEAVPVLDDDNPGF